MTTDTPVLGRADFSEIRYAQCWEDADVLIEALRPQPGGTCLSIASAGDNVLALLGAGAGRVIAVDMNPAQIACLELRVAAVRQLAHAEYLALLGQRPSRERLRHYRRCRPLLSARSRDFWDRRQRLIERGIARAGRFERYLGGFRQCVLPLVHRRGTIERLFELETATARQRHFENRWSNRRWAILCRLFFSNVLLGRFGRDPSFTRFADESVWSSVGRRLPRALVTQCPADNPYLQWILKGRCSGALPYAWRAENFARIRANIDRLEWHCGTIEQVLDRLPEASLQACNLSDIFEYMSAADYEKLLRQLVRAGAPGCRLAYWNVVTARKRPPHLGKRLRSLEALAARLHLEDKVFFYRDFVVEEVI